MSETTPNIAQDVKQTLERTELGHIINENKKSVIVGGIIIVLAIVSFSFYQYQKTHNLQDSLSETYSFEQQAVTPYLAGEMSAEDFAKKFEEVPLDILETQAFLPLALKVSDKLSKDNNEGIAVAILGKYFEKLTPASFSHYFLAVNYAAHLEDAGKTSEAIKVLEDAMKAKFETLKDKVYFDLGRLHLGEKNTQKAREMFEYVNKNFADSEYSKLANLYLAGMKK